MKDFICWILAFFLIFTMAYIFVDGLSDGVDRRWKRYCKDPVVREENPDLCTFEK